MEFAEHQQLSRHNSMAGEKLRVEQKALLNSVTKGKLDPRWTGPYVVTEIKGPSTVLLRISSTMVRAVHINCVRPFLTEVKDQTESLNWTPTPIPSQRGSNEAHF